jgi:CheY-like chemotaxis protein
VTLGGKTVLVVDDARPVVVLCLSVLRALGCEVTGVQDGGAAIALLQRQPFDLLVADYRMPGMTGAQLLHEARALHAGVRAILVTGHGTPEVVAEAEAIGFDAILLKPFTAKELRSVIERAFAGEARRAPEGPLSESRSPDEPPAGQGAGADPPATGDGSS